MTTTIENNEKSHPPEYQIGDQIEFAVARILPFSDTYLAIKSIFNHLISSPLHPEDCEVFSLMNWEEQLLHFLNEFGGILELDAIIFESLNEEKRIVNIEDRIEVSPRTKSIDVLKIQATAFLATYVEDLYTSQNQKNKASAYRYLLMMLRNLKKTDTQLIKRGVKYMKLHAESGN